MVLRALSTLKEQNIDLLNQEPTLSYLMLFATVFIKIPIVDRGILNMSMIGSKLSRYICGWFSYFDEIGLQICVNTVRTPSRPAILANLNSPIIW